MHWPARRATGLGHAGDLLAADPRSGPPYLRQRDWEEGFAAMPGRIGELGIVIDPVPGLAHRAKVQIRIGRAEFITALG